MLTVTALGVVYGDIGTSPLYAIQAALKATGRDAPGPLEVLGIVSLVFWALMLVVSLKYVAIVLCADNEGEGGILALLSLVSPAATLPPQGGTRTAPVPRSSRDARRRTPLRRRRHHAGDLRALRPGGTEGRGAGG